MFNSSDTRPQNIYTIFKIFSQIFTQNLNMWLEHQRKLGQYNDFNDLIFISLGQYIEFIDLFAN